MTDCSAAHRNRMPPPQRGKIHVPPVIAGDHREAGEAAFR
jgi:hypothetical protein